MPSLADVADRILARRGARSPYLVGITGAVAAGKSTFAAQLQDLLSARGETVEIVSTDGFLMNNAALEAKDLLMRKGFPESYDMEGLRAALAAIRQGPTEIPGYSHVIYDIDPMLSRRIDPPGVLLVEGLGLQDGAAALGLDALIYIDADGAHVEAWFTERFIGLWRAAEHDPASFYARFRHMSEDETRVFAGQVWRSINLPNLLQNIIRARAVADLVVTKGPDHELVAVREVTPV
jgi:type I pantothenate kinase